MKLPPGVWFLVHSNGLVVRDQEDRVGLPGGDDAEALGVNSTDAHEFGRLDGSPAFVASIDDARPIRAPLRVVGLRELYAALGDAGFTLAGRATQLVQWAQTSRYCGRCGQPTERVAGESSMRCAACGLCAYPRIAPAVIVLVRRGDEALLARNARAPVDFYTTLAGFVEAGEALETTLSREVREEVGINVADFRYFGSQSWPFPHSLMVAFTAEWAGGDIEVDGLEIADARWFRPNDLPRLPPPMSIARQLIDAWVAEVATNESGR